MNTRHISSSTLRALVVGFALVPAFLASAQTATPADASSTAAAPTEPAAPAAPAPAPAAAPAETTAPAPAAPTERPSTYTIAGGDSLWTIAHKFGTTVVKLRKLNKLKKGALLHPGQVLQIPPATADTATK